jgi:hypothetical protein
MRLAAQLHQPRARPARAERKSASVSLDTGLTTITVTKEAGHGSEDTEGEAGGTPSRDRAPGGAQ